MSGQEKASASELEMPVWRWLSLRAGAWRSIPGASEYLIRTIKYGIRDPPVVQSTRGAIIRSVLQNAENISFSWSKINKGLQEKIIEDVSEVYVKSCVSRYLLVSSPSSTCTGEGDDLTRRFLINLCQYSCHFRLGSTRMETLPSFLLQIQRNYSLMSFDVTQGYHHLFLHPSMREYFFSILVEDISDV